MDTPESVPASEFTRNFGRYRMRAQREPVAVSSHGQITGYFVGPDEYEEFKRFRQAQQLFGILRILRVKQPEVGRFGLLPAVAGFGMANGNRCGG